MEVPSSEAADWGHQECRSVDAIERFREILVSTAMPREEALLNDSVPPIVHPSPRCPLDTSARC